MPRGERVERTVIDAGDLDVFHPLCRTKILITEFEIQYGRIPSLHIEGICPTCDCYVHLKMKRSGL